jgi:hypothetical protein
MGFDTNIKEVTARTFHVSEVSDSTRFVFRLVCWNGRAPKFEVRPQFKNGDGEWKNKKLAGLNGEQLEILKGVLPKALRWLEAHDKEDWSKFKGTSKGGLKKKRKKAPSTKTEG